MEEEEEEEGMKQEELTESESENAIKKKTC